jgi:hypothetical protein
VPRTKGQLQAPLKILSVYVAARRYISWMFVPKLVRPRLQQFRLAPALPGESWRAASPMAGTRPARIAGQEAPISASCSASPTST